MNDIDKFINLIKESSQTTVLTGAGISTLSGIKDFRSSNGFYSKQFHHLNVEEILDYDFFFKHPEVFYSWAKDNWYDMEKYQPNIVHKTLTKLQDMNMLNNIFTQNIDMLHSKANSKNIYELHGSIERHYCTKCKKEYSYDEIAVKVKNDEIPKCSICGGLIKPKIVFYGENLDYAILDNAYNSFSNSDLAIALGSSLIVQPAASLVLYTVKNGGKLVIVNKDDTPLDKYATFKFDDLNSVFESINNQL